MRRGRAEYGQISKPVEDTAMIWSAQTIKARQLKSTLPTYVVSESWKQLEISPFYGEKSISNGMSFGLTAAGYDIRLGKSSDMHPDFEGIFVEPGEFELAHSLEFFRIPEDCQAIVHDKSSWARKGLSLFNTVLEPGWFGHITLELANHSLESILIKFGSPIAQIVFHQLDSRTTQPYSGKYQNQPNHPVRALREGEVV